MTRYVLAVLLLLLPAPLGAAEATVAVAANFLTTAQKLVEAFEEDTGHALRLAHGSTGRLYAQIVSGAPFDVFLAADSLRPERLEAEGLTQARRAYALGRLVLVSPEDAVVEPEALGPLRIAMADPEVAPYGAAAIAALRDLGYVPETMTLLMGDSVGQAATIFATGNAEVAFLAEAQLASMPRAVAAMPMDGRHPPIRQDVALLARAGDNAAARAFYDYLATPSANAILAASGYGVPN